MCRRGTCMSLASVARLAPCTPWMSTTCGERDALNSFLTQPLEESTWSNAYSLWTMTCGRWTSPAQRPQPPPVPLARRSSNRRMPSAMPPARRFVTRTASLPIPMTTEGGWDNQNRRQADPEDHELIPTYITCGDLLLYTNTNLSLGIEDDIIRIQQARCVLW